MLNRVPLMLRTAGTRWTLKQREWIVAISAACLLVVSHQFVRLRQAIALTDRHPSWTTTSASSSLAKSSNGKKAPSTNLAKIYMLPIPEMTDWLIGNFTAASKGFYANSLNENSAEVWLHRGFVHKTALTVDDPSIADIILVPSYLKLHALLLRLLRAQKLPPKMALVESYEDWAETIVGRIATFYKNHKIVLLTPCVSLEETKGLGVALLVAKLEAAFGQEAVYSVGFERNTAWQALPPSRIIIIPYVLKPTIRNMDQAFRNERHGVFYRGDLRPKAIGWSGCNRSMLIPLAEYSQTAANPEGINVQLLDKDTRISQEEYNDMLQHSDFCLAVCGDTVTSRSLASYMASGCIPVRIGSRLRGYCDEPCHPGWGWTYTNGSSHLPYPNMVNWDLFPELDELKFTQDPINQLRAMLRAIQSSTRQKLRQIMRAVHRGFVYGWGNPVDSIIFGDAVDYVAQSLSSEKV